MKNLVKVLSIVALLSGNAFADGSGPSNRGNIESCRGSVQSMWGSFSDISLDVHRDNNGKLSGSFSLGFDGVFEELESTNNINVGRYSVRAGLKPESIELIRDLNPGEKFISVYMASLKHSKSSWAHLSDVKDITVYDFNNFGEFSSEPEMDKRTMTGIGKWEGSDGSLQKAVLASFSHAECE